MAIVPAAFGRRETITKRTKIPMYYGPEHFLNRDANGGRIMAHARLLLKLARRFEAVAPPALRHAARVANYKSGKVVIHTEYGAVAVKLRQMSRRLCEDLSKGGAPCSELEVKVQPRQTRSPASTSTVKPLSGKAFDALQTTTEALPRGPLRAALEHLLARALRKE